MGTIKIIGFDEQGQAQRLKIRIARILDYDPVTSTEKENIRDSLGVDDSLSGTFTTPLSVTSASDSSFTGGGDVGIGASPGSTRLRVSGGSGQLFKVDDGGNALLTVDATGSVTIGQSDLVMSSGGIDFSSTSDGSGTMSSEVLADYEEGSATVSIVPDGGTVTLKSANNTIYYRKIGKLVHIAGELVVDSVSSPTGEFKISGLPYASENVNNNRSAISIHTSVLSSSSRMAAFVEKNQSFAYVRLTGGTGYGQTSATVLLANSGIVIGGSYHTA
tara:strand:- start:14998 stop:15822 length:825 start_codon:yes stop_codon:yes gene_type:complete